MRPLTCLLVALAATLAGCGPPPPYVRYQGNAVTRAPIPAESIEIFRTGPPKDRYKDLGTVSVTCPSEMEYSGTYSFGSSAMVGGCSYNRAVSMAAERAAKVGADGLHSLEAASNASGAVVSLRATTFYYLVRDPVSRRAQARRAPTAHGAQRRGAVEAPGQAQG